MSRRSRFSRRVTRIPPPHLVRAAASKAAVMPSAPVSLTPADRAAKRLAQDAKFILQQRGYSSEWQSRRMFSGTGAPVWDAQTREMHVTVQVTRAQVFQVRFLLTEDLDGFHAADCSCGGSSTYFLCPHTCAALRKLIVEISAAGSSLRNAIFGADWQPWRKTLRKLDSFVAKKEQGTEPDVPAKTTRLSYRIAATVSQASYQSSAGLRLAIYIYQQSLNKKGAWTKGRKVDANRALVDTTIALHPVDQRVLAILGRDSIYGYGGAGYSANIYEDIGYSDDDEDDDDLYDGEEDDLKAVGQANSNGRRNVFCQRGGAGDTVRILTELLGHPLVYFDDAPDAPIEVRRGELGLALDKGREGLRLLPAIDGERLGKDGIDAVMLSVPSGVIRIEKALGRITVAPADLSSVQLFAFAAEDAQQLPLDAEDELLRRLPALEARMPVKLPEEMLGGVEPADVRTFVRLTPLQPQGLSVALNVRPAPDGPLFDPGAGRAEITATRDGQRLLYRRDLDGEKSRGEMLAESLNLNARPAQYPWRWQLPTDDEALDLIAALEDRLDGDVVVEWPEGSQLSISREVTPQSLKVSIDDRNDWFGLKGTVEIEGEQVQLGVLLAGLRSGRRYIAIGKNRYVRIAKAFRDRLAALDDVVHETRKGLEIDITAAPVLEDLCGEDVSLKACKAWRDMITRLDAASELSPEPPITLAAELRDYQRDGYRWLRRLAEWGVGGCLADDMGLGKTVQTLAVLVDRMEHGPALVVAPTSVGFNWVRETERFAPTLRPVLYRETDRGDFLDSLGEGDVVIASYGLLLRDSERLAKVKWGTLVLDEAQKIKNAQTKTAQEVRKIEAKWRLALTGTPMENHLGELWSVFRAVCPGLFGSWDRFRERFAEPIERRRDAGRRHALSHVLRPFILRRTKAEVLDELPERTEIRRTAYFTADEKRKYEDTRLAAVARLAGVADNPAGEDRRFEILAALTKLRQLACHPKLVDASWPGTSAKLELLLEIVEELREGRHRALVFSQFTQHLALIRAALDERGIRYQYLDGQTPAKEREHRVDAFQRGDGDLFLISLKAGGTGLNLTAADYVIHMDPWWNPAVEDQATDRAHRIGQTRPVTVYRLVTADTIEDQILALHADKRHLVSGVLEGADQAAKLSSAELVALIRGGAAQTDEKKTARKRLTAT